MTAAVIEAPGVAPLNLSEAGSWLCSQDEMLRELVQRIGAWSDDAGSVEMPKVRDAVIAHDAGAGRWTNVGAQRMRVMSPAEVGRLRMLATLAPLRSDGQAVRFCVGDLETFNATDEGRFLIEDYLRCVRIGVLG